MNATKDRIGEDALGDLFADARVVIAAKGKKVVRLDLAGDPAAASELAGVALGPTGNLRAPTARIGKTWLIGFNEDEYARVLG